MQENKKSRKWLWIVIAIVAVLAVVGVVLGIVLSGPSDGPGGEQGNAPKGGRADLYWNIDRALYSNATTGMSVREPEVDGTYKVTFAHEGEQKDYIIRDKRLVNYIDTADVMGLEFDENGQIVDAINVTNLATELAKNFYVLKVEGNVITLNGSPTFDGMAKTITCEELTKIYDLSGPRETKGEIVQPEDLQPLDTVLIYGNDMDQATHIGVMVRPPESAIYWRAEQHYSYVLDTLGTTREPDENGIYTVDMFSNGELVSLKFRNKEDVNNVDKVMANQCHFGLIFDEDGYVVGVQPSQNGIRGKVACNQYDVTSVDGRSFVATGVVDTNYIGYTYEGTVPEGVGVYDVSWRYSNKLRGKDVGMVQVGDRITVWEDTLGNIVEIYIYIHKVPGPICYRMDNLINRQPDAKGWYTFEMLIEGKVKTVKTKNEEIARFLEGNAYVALDLDGNVIKEAYDYTQVVMRGYTDMVKQGWSVANVAGQVVTLENPQATSIAAKVASNDLKVYNISGVHQQIGAETELRVGDRGNFISDATGQLVYAVITSRMVDADVYFNLTVKYDNRNKCTTRVPDENGYYVFNMAHGGKQVTIKTKSKAVASAIDAIAHQVVALKPDKNGVVKEAFPGDYATGGVVRMGGDYTFEGYTEDGQMQFARKVTPDVKVYYNPADKIKTYNVSQVGFKKFRGEEDKFAVGDQALILTNIRNKVEYFFIVSSDAKTITQYCPHCKKKVAFEPWIGTNLSFRDGKSGHIYLPGNGQDLPCSILGDHPNERAMDLVIDLRGNTARFEKGSRGFIISNYIKLSIMDSKGGGRMIGTGVAGEAAGLIAGNNNSTINLYSGSLEAAKDHSGIALGGAVYVGGTSLLNVYGGKIYSADKTLEALYIDTGATVNINNGANIGSMSVAPDTTLKLTGKITIGKLMPLMNRLIDFTKLDKKSSIGVVARGPFTTEMSNPEAYLGMFNCPVKGGSIVVEGNQLACYGTEPDLSEVYELSKDMDFSNTKKLPKYCPKCDKNVIWQPLPKQDSKTSGANHLLPGNAHFYVPKGGITISNIYVLNSGDVCLHLADQTITNNTVEAFAVFGGKTLTIMGDGKIRSTCKGGIASILYNAGTVNICGGTYESTRTDAQPIVCNLGSTGNLINLYDGTLKHKSVALNTKMETAKIFGGTVEGTVMTQTNGTLEVSGGKLEAVKIAKDSELQLSGAPVIQKLTLLDGVLAQVGELKTGAKIAVNVTGIFTADFANESAADAAIKYFAGMEEGALIKRDGKALTCVPAPFDYKTVLDKINAQTFTGNAAGDAGYCYHCKENVTWMPITAATYINDSGHYYLANDITNAADSTIVLSKTGGQNVCLHLNGKTVENTGAACSAILLWGAENKLNLMGDGVVKNKSANWAAFESKQNVVNNIYGGKFINESGNARAVQVAKGTTYIYGATIENSYVFGVGGTTVVEGGTCYGVNDSVAGKIVLKDVAVTNATVTTGTLELDGATVDTVKVAATATALKISGKTVINNLNMNEAVIKAEIGELVAGADIKVNANGVFTTEFESEDAAEAAAQYFTAAARGANVVREGKVLVCAAMTPAQIAEEAKKQTFTGTTPVTEYCYVCGVDATWQPITEATTINAAGHYFLANDVTASGAHGVNTWGLNGVTACLHLNGKTLKDTVNGYCGIVKYGTGTLNVMGGGRAENASAGWGALETKAGTMNVYGITAANTSGGNHGVMVNANTTMNLYGVNVSESLVTAAGGNLNIDSGSYKKINVTGCAVSVAGAPVIANLNMSGATTKLTVGKLTTGADIKVSANGVFTAEFTDEAAAEAALQYFTAAARGAAISREGKTLICAAMTPVQIAEEAKKQTFSGTEAVNEYCYVCGADATWQPITAATHIASNGHYFLANDITGNSSGEPTLYTWGPTTSVCLHLNGKKVEHTNRLAAINNMKPIALNIMGNGSLVNASSSYGTVVSGSAGSVNLYGTAVVNGAGHQYGFTLTNGTMNLYNVSAESGAVNATAGTVNIDSGKIMGVTVTAGQVSVTGAPVIPNLNMSAATTKLTVGKLVTGAEIKVIADGVFTGDIADVNAAKAFFSAVAADKTIAIVGQTLSCVNAG